MAKKRYFWSSVLHCVLQVQDGAGETQDTYTHEPSLYSPLVGENRSGQARQYHFDALGSTRALTNDSQAVTDTFSYDAWGNRVTSTGTGAIAQRWRGRFGWTTLEVLRAVSIAENVYEDDIGSWSSPYLMAGSTA